MQKNSPNEASRFLQRDSQGVRMVGKWGHGPSSRVSGKDSLVFLSLGSEVAIINFANPQQPQILYEIQGRGGAAKTILRDSFLYIVCAGIQIWNIRNPSNPVFKNSIITNVSDFCIKDTFLYAVAGDSFRIFNIANLDNLYRVGKCAVVGFYLSVSGNYAYISDQGGVYIVNIQNPANPYLVNTWGGAILSAQAKDTFCYVSTYDPMNPDWVRFTILNVSNPNSIQEISHINNAGGYDIYLLNYFAYISGYYLPVGEFQIIDISNPTFPTVVSRCTTPGWNNGVWVDNPFGYAFVADDWEGLQIININNPTNPYRDSTILGADYAMDVYIDSNFAYVADLRAGLKIIDIDNPAIPYQIGQYDTMGQRYDMWSAVAKDSFAYIGAPIPYVKFGVLNINPPSQPTLIGISQIFNGAEDMVIRDSFVYIAEESKFEIFSVANPRQPRLVGSCNLPTGSSGLCIQDTIAYVAPDLHIVSIANPANPRLISRTPNNSWKVEVHDTFAYISHAYESLLVYSVANSLSPYELGWVHLNGQGYDVVVKGNYAYVGCYDFRVFDISNPANPILVGYYTTPGRVRRLFADSQYIYAACFAYGMCIFEQLPSGIEENHNEISITKLLKITPNPTSSRFNLELNRIDDVVLVYNLAGKLVKQVNWSKQNRQIDISNLPDGVYFISSKHSNNKILSKVVKISR
jgi:hypothetical protein